MQFQPAMLVQGPGSKHLMMTADHFQISKCGGLIWWPWYKHTESYVAMHLQRMNFLVNLRLFAEMQLLIVCGTAFYAIITVYLYFVQLDSN